MWFLNFISNLNLIDKRDDAFQDIGAEAAYSFIQRLNNNNDDDKITKNLNLS